tara:strand:+ start:183 stop:299 length:117 start_codon:yes stop_codon:yes gene_type:complete
MQPFNSPKSYLDFYLYKANIRRMPDSFLKNFFTQEKTY